MSWLYLLLAGGSEVLWAVGLKYTHGFTRLLPSVFTVFFMVASFYFLAHALRTLPLGMAYAIWTGIGTIGTVTCGIFLFGESMSIAQLGCIGLILAGIIGLRVLA